MLKTTLTLAAVSLTLLLSTSVFAQSIKYLGAHHISDQASDPEWVTGGLGVLEFNRRCAAAFDGAQMCESIDILRSGSLPDDAAVTEGVVQWVKPTITHVVLDPDPTLDPPLLRLFDVSGASTILPGGLSCLGWSTSSSNNTGLIVNGDGKFFTNACNFGDFFAVACCKVTSGKKK